MRNLVTKLLVGALSVSLAAMMAVPSYAAVGSGIGTNAGSTKDEMIGHRWGLHYPYGEIARLSAEESQKKQAICQDSLDKMGLTPKNLKEKFGLPYLSFTEDVELKVGEKLELHVTQPYMLSMSDIVAEKVTLPVYFEPKAMKFEVVSLLPLVGSTDGNLCVCFVTTVTGLQEGTEIMVSLGTDGMMRATRIVVKSADSKSKATESETGKSESAKAEATPKTTPKTSDAEREAFVKDALKRAALKN